MRRLTIEPVGIVLNVYGKNLIISLKSSAIEGALPLRQKVVDKQKNDIGIIVDVFGPIKSPYAVVRPFKKRADLSSIMKRDVYIKTRKNRKE